MSCVRLARGYTARPKYLKFSGCYHGHSDVLLATGGEAKGKPFEDGIDESVHESAVIGRYNDIRALDGLFAKHGRDLAAVVVEPVGSNMGVVPPVPGFLQALRRKCDESGALLIFDEVVTGFRFRYGSTSAMFDVQPDFVTYGKIIGGGLPIGAYVSRLKYLELLSHRGGGVFQGGTFAGNPMSMAAGRATLQQLSDPAIYEHLERLGAAMESGIRAGFARVGLPFGFQRVGSLASLILVEGLSSITNLEEADRQNTALFGEYHRAMCDRGILLPPSITEPIFISAVHTDADIQLFVDATVEILSGLVAS